MNKQLKIVFKYKDYGTSINKKHTELYVDGELGIDLKDIEEIIKAEFDNIRGVNFAEDVEGFEISITVKNVSDRDE